MEKLKNMTGGGKRRKITHCEPLAQLPEKGEETKQQTVIIQFRNPEEEDVGFEIAVDSDTSKADLNKLLAEVREPEEGEDDYQLFQFYLDDKEVKQSIQEVLDRIQASKLKDA